MLTLIGILLILLAVTKFVWQRLVKNREEQIQQVRDYNANRSEYDSKAREPKPMMKFPIGGKIWYFLVGGIFTLMLNGVFFWAEAGTAYAVQYPWGGDKMVTTQGLKVKWWGRIIPLSYEISVKDVKTKKDTPIPESGDGIYNRAAKQWEFSDAIKANIEYAVVIGVNTNDQDAFLNMADRNRSEGKLIYGRVLPNIDAALKNTCKLMDAQEYISGKASDFDRYFRDQLENGMYQIEEYWEKNDELEIIGDSTVKRQVRNLGSQDSKQRKYRIKRDKSGSIVRDNNSNTLKQYGIVIHQAQVTGIDWESAFDKRLQLQKEQVAQTQLEKQEAEKEFHRANKEKMKGEAEKTKERARLEKEQIKQTIAAETRLKVAEQDLMAEKKRYEVEQYKAKSKKVAADAQAYENQRLVSAGLTPQERAQLELDKAKAVAEAFAKMKTPEVIINSGDGKGGSDITNSLIQAEMAKQLLNKNK